MPASPVAEPARTLSDLAFRFPAIARRLLRGRWGAVLLLAAFVSLPACYDPNSIEKIALSPDARFAAVVTSDGELGVIDLGPAGDKVIYTRMAGRGIDWSGDSRRLLFVEKLPDEPYRLQVVQLGDRKTPARTLLSQPDWIADPIWLDENQIAFLSTREGTDANLWVFDLRTGELHKRMDRPQEISQAWSVPGGGQVLFQCLERGLPQLWLWEASRADEPRLLPRAEGDVSLEQRLVAIAPDGRGLAVLPRGTGPRPLLYYDLRMERPIASHTIVGPVESMAVLGDGRIALAQNLSLTDGSLRPVLDLPRLLTTEAENAIILWNPDPGLFGKEIELTGWANLPLTQLERFERQGALMAVNTNVLMLADDIESIAEGNLFIRRTEDAIFMILAQARNGHLEMAREALRRLWDLPGANGPERAYLLAMARAQVERMSGDWDEALRWIEEAIAAEPDSYPMLETAWMEYLAVAWFGAGDTQRAGWALRQMPAEMRSTPLAVWVSALIDAWPGEEARAWTGIIRDLRAHDLPAAARGAQRAIHRDAPTTLALTGLELMLNGEIEPAATAVGVQWLTTERLMERLEFQQAMLTAGRLEETGVGLPPSDLRTLVLSQWLRRGDVRAAQQLVQEDLSATATTNMDYSEILLSFLEPEEQEPWMERAVSDVLLAEPVAPALRRLFSDPAGRLMTLQARIKASLIAGDMAPAVEALEEAVLLISQPEARQAADADVLFRLTLYQAKVNERQGEWEAAAEGYRAALRWMARDARAWQPTGSELALSIGLLAHARDDRELLQSYLRIQRGLGDPVINPTHDAATLRAALDNLRTLRQFSTDAAWLAPYLAYCEAIIWSLLRYPMQALESIEEVKRLDPDPTLLQRALLEEAAIREHLGQFALAARIYERIYRMELPIAVRGPALLSGIVAEISAGLTDLPGDRLDELAAEVPIPPNWLRWLRLQLAADLGG